MACGKIQDDQILWANLNIISNTMCLVVKELDHLIRIKMSRSFSHPHIIKDINVFPSSVEKKLRFFLFFFRKRLYTAGIV